MLSFGENLQMLKSAFNLSLGELAIIIHMRSINISWYERNQSRTSIEVARRNSEALNMLADQLIFGNFNQMAAEKIQYGEVLNVIPKVKNLIFIKVHCVKSLLDAYLIKSELLKKFNVK